MKSSQALAASTNASISAAQLAKLQTLWSQHARHSLDVPDDSRQERLVWASAAVGRKISSFKDLTLDEASHLIDALAAAAGIITRDRAHAMGTDGRRGARRRVLVIASQADQRRIQDAVERLGWDQEHFNNWLASTTSPLKSREKQVRTQADANRVWWALKSILRRQKSESGATALT
jgi:hypothetical protein